MSFDSVQVKAAKLKAKSGFEKNLQEARGIYLYQYICEFISLLINKCKYAHDLILRFDL